MTVNPISIPITYDKDMLTVDQWISIGVPAVVTFIAFLLTRWYQDKIREKDKLLQESRYQRDLELQKRQKKSEWVLLNGIGYMGISATCRILKIRLDSDKEDPMAIFFDLIYFIQRLKTLSDKVPILYFDDLQGEIFVDYMFRQMVQLIRAIFDNDPVKTSYFRQLIVPEGSLTELREKIEKDKVAKELYETFIKWLSNPTNKKKLRNYLFVTGMVLEYEVNKMLLVTYSDEIAFKEEMKKRFDTSLPEATGLQDALEDVNNLFEEESGFRFRMYSNGVLLI